MDIDEFLDQETKIELSKLTKEEVKADKDIMNKIHKIHELIRNKLFHDAEKGYLEAREMYQEFVKEQEKVRSLLKDELLALNKELVDNLSATRAELLRRIKAIRSLMERTNTILSQGKIHEANELYVQIKALFTNLPDIQSEEKTALENDILGLYSKILQSTTKKSQGEFKIMYSKINDLIAQCKQTIQNNKFEEAKKVYAEINKAYSQLPQGFLYEKSMLHNQVIELHDALVRTMKQEPLKKNAR